MNRFDRHIIGRLSVYTAFLTMVLIGIFIMVDFSENSDDFIDKGASAGAILRDYYLHYVPEMVRLVAPLAAFIACLFLTTRKAERLEWIALKSSGVSLYRLFLPYLLYGLSFSAIISLLDSSVVPQSNSLRFQFEQQYMSKGSDKLDRGTLYRQISDSSVIHMNFFDANSKTIYRARIVTFEGDQVHQIRSANRLHWADSLAVWKTDRLNTKTFGDKTYAEKDTTGVLLDLNLLPKDLSRRTSDVYQLTYGEAFDYIEATRRVGAGGLALPQTKLFSRITYPISIFTLVLIGFAVAGKRRRGGKGFFIAFGFVVTILYLVATKMAEPFGTNEVISPLSAAIIPHLLFLAGGLVMLRRAET